MRGMIQSETVILCRFWVEQLEPVSNVRPRFYLGKTENVEDKEHLIPFFSWLILSMLNPRVVVFTSILESRILIAACAG